MNWHEDWGMKFFPSLQILSSWWIISFERPDLPRGLDPCYRAEAIKGGGDWKKEVVKMDLPIIVIDVIFWSGALCKNVGIWGTGTLHCICQFWHDQENIKLHISMTSSSLFWITSKSTLTQCLKVHPKCLSLQHYERSKQQLISKIKVIGLFPPKIYIRTKLIPFGGKIQIFEVPIICWDIFVDFQTVYESWYGTTYLL